MPMQDNLIRNLEMAIQRSGITQYQLAESAGIHRVTLSRIMTRHLEPSLAIVEKLAKSLDVVPSERLLQKNCFGAEKPLEVR